MMAIREDIVTSAAQFLQDPTVAASSLDSRVAFLRTKNLSPQEIDVALNRAGQHPRASAVPGNAHPPADSHQHNPPYLSQSQHGWQQTPSLSRRDWRDWFIMATVVGGVGYGLYALGKRYVYPLIAPPTPERLEQDKKSIEQQFDRAFALLDQLAKDMDTVKAAEQDRTQRLDHALADLETMVTDTKAVNNGREDEARRIRNDVQNLKEAIPKAMDAQKDITDNRLREVTVELASLKTLFSQRLGSTSAITSGPGGNPLLRATRGNSVSQMSSAVPASKPGGLLGDNASDEPAPPMGISRASTFSGAHMTPRASIPSWQLAVASKSTVSPSTVNGVEGSSVVPATSGSAT